MNLQLTRRFSGVILTIAGVLLATGSVYALRRPPFLSWIRDQSIIQTPAPTFALQYFRVNDFDGSGVTFNINFSIPNILDPMKVKVARRYLSRQRPDLRLLQRTFPARLFFA